MWEKVLDLAASWSSSKMWNPHLTAKGFTIGSQNLEKIEWTSQNPSYFHSLEKISQISIEKNHIQHIHLLILTHDTSKQPTVRQTGGGLNAAIATCPRPSLCLIATTAGPTVSTTLVTLVYQNKNSYIAMAWNDLASRQPLIFGQF